MTIEEALSAIKNAVYGKDVRQAMHDGILQAEGGAGTVAKEAAKSAKEAEIASRAIEGKADQAVIMARSANSKSDNTQLQLDEIVINGDSSVEAAQARVDIENISYATLKDRLDKEQQEVTAQLAQTEKISSQMDFVDFVKNQMQSMTNMYFSKTATNTYQVKLNNREKGIVYQFIKDNNDDFIKIDSCGVGLSDALVERVNPAAGDTADPLFANGTFIASSAHFYTTTVGDFIETELGGNLITLYALTESRGGLWEYVIDNEIYGSLSLYNDTTQVKTFTLAENLEPDVKHTILLTFKGDDPNNPPSSTPSRGYISSTADADSGALAGRLLIGSLDTEILASTSNKEFAFYASKNGSSNWIPEHNAIGSTFKNIEPIFILDGISKSDNELQLNELYPIKSFELIQDLNGQVVGEGDVLNLKSRHTINPNGGLSYSGSFKALSYFEIVSGYPMMLVALNSNLKDFFTSYLNNKTSVGDESEYYFNEEKNNAVSGVVIDSVNNSLVGAMTMKQPLKTYRKNKSSVPAMGENLFLWQRATKPKLYWQSFENASIATGDLYSWSFDMVVSDIDDIYNMVKE